MADNTFQDFIKNPTLKGQEQTVFGIRPGGERIGFENPEQLASVGGTDKVKEDTTFNPGDTFRTFSQFQQPVTGATPVKLDVQPQIPEKIMSAEPITSAEISSRLLTAQENQTKRLDTFLEQTKALQEQTIATTTPTEQEKEIQLEISDITQQARQLRASFKAGRDELTGQTIPAHLAMGRARELENQVNRQLESLSLIQAPLADTLQTLQSAREVKLTQLGILRDFASQNFQLLQQNSTEAQALTFDLFKLQQEEQRFEKKEQDAAKEFAIENNITSPLYDLAGIYYDTQTGEAKYQNVGGEIKTMDGQTVFSTPQEFFVHSGLTSFDQIQKAPTAGVAEERSLVFDLIKTYPDAGILPTDNFATAQSKLPSSRIYQDKVRPPIGAGGGGGGGGFGDLGGALSPEAQAVIQGTLRLEDLTPTVRGKIAGELTAAGFKSGPKLSSSQQDDLALMDTTAGQINQILNYNKDGKSEGVGFVSGPIRQGLIKMFGKGSEEAKNVQVLISNIKGTIAKLRGGTSFTPNEEKLLASYTPNINESSASVINKLNLLNDFINNKKYNLFNFAQERGVPSQEQDLRTKYNY